MKGEGFFYDPILQARSQGSNGRGSGVDNALLAKAAAFEGRSDSRLWGGTSSFSSPSASVAGSPGDCRALIQPLGDNCDQEKNSQPKVGLCEGSFKCPKNIMESPLGKDLVVRSKEQVSSELKSFNWPRGRRFFLMISFLSWLVSIALWGCQSRDMKRRFSPS